MGDDKLNDLAPDVQDEVLKLVIAGHRSGATLILYRLLDCTLEEAWYIMNGLSDDSSFESPDQDMSFTRVETYLMEKGSRQETKYFILAALLFIAVGGTLAIIKWPRLQTGLDSYFWDTTDAEVVDIAFTSKRYSTKYQSVIHYINYRYEYSVHGSTNRGVGRRSYIPDWEETFEMGDSIEILYNPRRPEESMHDRNMYSRALWVIVGMIITLPGFGIFGFGAFQKLSDRGLKKLDPHFAAQ